MPVSRMLFSLASMAMPALISGTASTATEFREARTNAVYRLPVGRFRRTLPPGEYTSSSGGAVSHLTLLAGARYELGDLRNAVGIVLTARAAADGEVRIEARLFGSGSHTIELRTFNGKVNIPSSTLTLTAGREQTVSWQLKAAAADTPWAVVAVPDSNITPRQDLSGTLRELPQIGSTAAKRP